MKRETALRPANWLSGLDRSAKVEGIVPAGFESYLRILHKGHLADTDGPGASSSIRQGGRPLRQHSGANSCLERDGLNSPGPTGSRPRCRDWAPSTRPRKAVLAAFWTGWEPVSEDSESARVIRNGDTVSIQGEQ